MASTSSNTPLSDKRLYIGNLSATIDEYSLMQLCAKYGKISKLDYLFHKTGPQKGKPRGYAFVEYATKEEAQRAMISMQDKLVRGRKMSVSLASEQDPKELNAIGGKKRRSAAPSELARPTAISLLKGRGVSQAPTNSKIAALEAKLALMKQKKDASPSTSTSTSTSNPNSGASTPNPEEVDTFLNGVLPNMSESKRVDENENGGKGSTMTGKIDLSKAGLPVRPYFESIGPPREL